MEDYGLLMCVDMLINLILIRVWEIWRMFALFGDIRGAEWKLHSGISYDRKTK